MINIRMDIRESIRQFLVSSGYDRIRLKAVLFDMDGVLFDSMKNHTLAWQKAMAARGISADRNEFYLYEGCTGKGTIDQFFRRIYGREADEKEVEQIYQAKSRFFNEMPTVEIMPGIRDILFDLKKYGLKAILVTGSAQHSLLDRLEKEFPGVFLPAYRVTAADVKQGKPSPEPYLRGLAKAGVRADEALVIENAPMGVQAAVAAGIFTIAVNTGPIPPQKLYEAGADILFPDMLSLAAVFGEIVGLFKEEYLCQERRSPTTSE